MAVMAHCDFCKKETLMDFTGRGHPKPPKNWLSLSWGKYYLVFCDDKCVQLFYEQQKQIHPFRTKRY